MDTRAIEAALAQLANTHGGQYAAFQRYERKDGSNFYSVNIHRGDFVRTASGNTIADALNKLGDVEWFDARFEEEAA